MVSSVFGVVGRPLLIGVLTLMFSGLLLSGLSLLPGVLLLSGVLLLWACSLLIPALKELLFTASGDPCLLSWTTCGTNLGSWTTLGS